MTGYDLLKERLYGLATSETYSPTHKEDGISMILSMAEDNDSFGEYIEIIENNPNEDFDGIAKLIFTGMPELEVVDDED